MERIIEIPVDFKATPSINGSPIATEEYVNDHSSGASYKVYTALLKQTNESAPVYSSLEVGATGDFAALEDTIGITSIEYVQPGLYQLKSDGKFLPEKTFLPPYQSYAALGVEFYFSAFWTDINTINIQTVQDGVPSDNVLGLFGVFMSIEVRVYD